MGEADWAAAEIAGLRKDRIRLNAQVNILAHRVSDLTADLSSSRANSQRLATAVKILNDDVAAVQDQLRAAEYLATIFKRVARCHCGGQIEYEQPDHGDRHHPGDAGGLVCVECGDEP